MNDLERDLRDLLMDDAEDVPTPTAAPEGLRRGARLRQAAFVSLTGAVVVAVVAIGALAIGALPPRDARAPADRPTTTRTLNGITIAFPEPWHLIDPDEAGLNGPQPTRDLPRLVLALSPQAPNDMLACPGMVEDTPPSFLMTVQEEPVALTGEASAPWPVPLEPIALDASTGGCYPGWEFLRAGWTAAGRTFEARVGLAPNTSDADRDAVFAAFASMTFAPTGEAPTSVVLTSGTIAGQDYELVATSGPGGLSLTLQGASFGTGVSAAPGSDALQLTSWVFGSGPQAVHVVFGVVPADAVRVVRTSDPFLATQQEYPILDVPDEIDARANAFLAVGGDGSSFEAFDAAGNVVARGTLGPDASPSIDLEDGRHFGYVRSVEVAGRTIEFDLASFLSGEEANRAYQEATGLTGPVPNDHFVVNDSTRLRRLSLSSDLRLRLLDWNRCCDTFFDGDLAPFAQAIETQNDVIDGDLIYRGQSQWWITVRDGVVTEIEEQYSP